MIRLTVTIIIILSLFVLPWWFTAAMLLVAFFYFPFFLEGLALAVVFDLVFGWPGAVTPFLASLSAIVVLVLVELIKTRTRLVS